jgi:hypothetical protein
MFDPPCWQSVTPRHTIRSLSYRHGKDAAPQAVVVRRDPTVPQEVEGDGAEKDYLAEWGYKLLSMVEDTSVFFL